MYQIDQQPKTVRDWLNIMRQHRDSAELLQGRRSTRNQAAFHCNLAIEAALKAVLMVVSQRSVWWTVQERGDVYIHDLKKLCDLVGINASTIAPTDPVAPAFVIAWDWERKIGYNPGEMPKPVIKSAIEIAFGRHGILTWLQKNYLTTI